MATAETATTEPQQVPPRDFDAEQAVLGSILLQPGAAARAFAIVSADDFYWENHRDIYAAMQAIADNEPVDLVTVSHELRRQRKLEQVGGGTYLTALIGTVPTAAHVVRYANIVAECSIRRQSIALSALQQAEAYDTSGDTGALIAQWQERFTELIGTRMTSGLLRPVGDSIAGGMDRQLARLEDQSHEISSARTGIGLLDRIMGGLEGERMICLLADTKHGKSQMATQIALETARQFQRDAQASGKPPRVVAWFILEEDEDNWFANVVSYLGGVNNKVLKKRGWWPRYKREHPWAEEAWSKGWSELASLSEVILPNWTAYDVRTIGTLCRALVRQSDLGLIVIDYAQKLRGFDNEINEERQAARRAEYLDDLTKELLVPAIVPSQITDRRDIKVVMPKGCKRWKEVATSTWEWRRDREGGKFRDHGYLICHEARIEGFAPLELYTQMECGRFWDADDWSRLQQERHAEIE